MDSHFHYNVVPNPNGQNVSTRVVFQDDLLQPELVATVATETGLTPAQITQAGTAILRQIILAGKISRVTRRLFGLFTFTPRSGGSQPDADFQPTVENMNVSLNASLAPDGQALFETGLTFQRDGVLGERGPVINRVYDAAARATDRCTPGGPFKIGGHEFGQEPGATATGMGLFLKPVAGGAAVRIGFFSEWTATEIMGAWPAGLTGAQQLSIVTTYEGSSSPRTFIYGTNLTP